MLSAIMIFLETPVSEVILESPAFFINKGVSDSSSLFVCTSEYVI